MQFKLTGCKWLSPDGVRDDPLYIDNRTGRIIERNPKAHDIRLEGVMLLPGLINAHDHLELNHFPRTKYRDVYPNAHVWGEDVSARLGEEPFKSLQAYPLWERCLIGGLKNILSGVTTAVHHNPYHRPLHKNWFPLDVLKNYGWAHSLHFDTPEHIKKAHRDSAPHPFMMHLAEGTDESAQAEFKQLEALGLVDERLVIIHSVGLTEADTKTAIDRGASLVWCPSTNDYLLDATVNVQQWYEARRLMLGSDSRLTADGDLLDELRAAHATGQLPADALWHLISDFPAQCLGLQDVGTLAVGNRANIIGIPLTDDPFETLVNLQRSDLLFVMRRGRVVICDPELDFPQDGYSPVKLDGRAKMMVARLVKRLKRMSLEEPGLSLI
ncbi:MAG: amidohydrolase family protein [Chloroflexi bacterium]|nr:amidohydrolase family protein [Chloroflexota bacterium]